jgi:hypothetical protein
MAELSRFFGIIIRMFSEKGERHHLPHFHAFYQEHTATFALDPIDMVDGSLPNKQRRLVEAWAELHLEELMRDWQLLDAGKKPLKIQPLQ